MHRSKSIYIFGYSGHSHVVLDSISKLDIKIKGYFDLDESEYNPFSIRYFGNEKKIDINEIVKDDFVFPTVGDNKLKEYLILFLKKKN